VLFLLWILVFLPVLGGSPRVRAEGLKLPLRVAKKYTLPLAPTAAPVISHGIMYYGSGTRMLALDLAAGRQLWLRRSGAVNRLSPYLTPDGGRVVFLGGDRRVYLLRRRDGHAEATLRAHYSRRRPPYLGWASAAPEGVFAAVTNGVFTVDLSTNRMRWKEPARVPLAVSAAGSVLAYGAASRLTARAAADGRVLWRRDMKRFGGLLAAVPGFFVAVDEGRTLLVLDAASGAVEGRRVLEGEVRRMWTAGALVYLESRVGGRRRLIGVSVPEASVVLNKEANLSVAPMFPPDFMVLPLSRPALLEVASLEGDTLQYLTPAEGPVSWLALGDESLWVGSGHACWRVTGAADRMYARGPELHRPFFEGLKLMYPGAKVVNYRPTGGNIDRTTRKLALVTTDDPPTVYSHYKAARERLKPLSRSTYRDFRGRGRGHARLFFTIADGGDGRYGVFVEIGSRDMLTGDAARRGQTYIALGAQ